jgi:hypothetical protein
MQEHGSPAPRAGAEVAASASSAMLRTPTPIHGAESPTLRRSPRLHAQVVAACEVNQQILDVGSPRHDASRRSPRRLLPMSSEPVPRPLAPDMAQQCKRKRTIAQIVTARKSPLPPGFPFGPWTTDDAAINEINAHCRRVEGGGFSVVRNSLIPATSRAGGKRLLKCHRHSKCNVIGGLKRVRLSQGVGCKWQMHLEEAEEGWVVSEVGIHSHNHDLAISAIQKLLHSSMREIPEHLLNFGVLSKKAGQSPAQIHE